MANAAVYIRSASVVTRKIDGETLIVPVRSGVGDLSSIYSLNELGTFIWEALAEPCTQEMLLQRVLEAYETTTGQAQRDVEHFIAQMLSTNLLETVMPVPGVAIAILQTPVSVEART